MHISDDVVADLTMQGVPGEREQSLRAERQVPRPDREEPQAAALEVSLARAASAASCNKIAIDGAMETLALICKNQNKRENFLGYLVLSSSRFVESLALFLFFMN